MSPQLRSDIVEDLVGVRFLSGGRDPKEGLDCAGLGEEIYRRLGWTWPAWINNLDYTNASDPSETGPLFEAGRSRVIRVEDPRPGDLVAICNDDEDPDLITHIGVKFLTGPDGKVIHATEKNGVRLTYDKALRIEGYYRFAEEDPALEAAPAPESGSEPKSRFRRKKAGDPPEEEVEPFEGPDFP